MEKTDMRPLYPYPAWAPPGLELEACVETLEEALAAEAAGATRLELCSRLDLGGLTPAFSLLKDVLAAVRIPVKAMLRARGGGFCYSKSEKQALLPALQQMLDAGVHEVVTGALYPDGNPDLEFMAALTSQAPGIPFTFHKAIDEASEPVAAARQLSQVEGIRYILTSGAQPRALEGAATIQKMQAAAGQGIIVIAAGKVTRENLAGWHRSIGAREYHGRRLLGCLIKG